MDDQLYYEANLPALINETKFNCQGKCKISDTRDMMEEIICTKT